MVFAVQALIEKSMSSDYEAFASHMPAYQIKSLYVQLIRITSDFLGVDEYKAINLISLSSVLGIVFLLLASSFNLIFWFLSIFGVLVLSQVLHLSRLMTPDALSSLVFLCSVVLILRNLKVAGFFLLILALLVRPSNIVYTGLIPLFLLKDKKFIYFLLLSSVSLFVYYLNAKIIGGLGWWKSFHSSLIGMPTTFIGYEWTGAKYSGNNLHRNIIFENSSVPELPVSFYDATSREELWNKLDSECTKIVSMFSYSSQFKPI